MLAVKPNSATTRFRAERAGDAWGFLVPFHGTFLVQAINAVGRRKGRIIEVEEVDSRERFYDSARKMQQIVETLRVSSGEYGHDGIWTPDTDP